MLAVLRSFGTVIFYLLIIDGIVILLQHQISSSSYSTMTKTLYHLFHSRRLLWYIYVNQLYSMLQYYCIKKFVYDDQCSIWNIGNNICKYERDKGAFKSQWHFKLWNNRVAMIAGGYHGVSALYGNEIRFGVNNFCGQQILCFAFVLNSYMGKVYHIQRAARAI